MYSFENYTLVIYETSKEYYTEVPENRFIAFLKEIPEASLHEYGDTQLKAIENLRSRFKSFLEEAKKNNCSLPRPEERDDVTFSGKIVLRMPSWLHRTIDHLADAERLSTNSYIVQRLIRTVTIEEIFSCLQENEEKLISQIKYLVTTNQEPTIFTKKSRSKLDIYVSTNQKLEYEPTRYRKAI
jgi:predicted HicB family RNase H-like nuclease